ncbi:MAG: GNAT family N-acetyltransferase [Ignavibacteria bacterium]|jgi:ElaA protein
MNVQWKCIPFNALTVQEVYDILGLRQDIFIIEQACIYQDIDGIDLHSQHVLAHIDEQLIAYSRIIPTSDSAIVKLGRIIVHSDHRGNAFGKQLVHYSINEAKNLFTPNHIHISAQTYLLKFYESIGFHSISESYDLDGITHIDMSIDII